MSRNTNAAEYGNNRKLCCTLEGVTTEKYSLEATGKASRKHNRKNVDNSATQIQCEYLPVLYR